MFYIIVRNCTSVNRKERSIWDAYIGAEQNHTDHTVVVTVNMVVLYGIESLKNDLGMVYALIVTLHQQIQSKDVSLSQRSNYALYRS